MLAMLITRGGLDEPAPLRGSLATAQFQGWPHTVVPGGGPWSGAWAARTSRRLSRRALVAMQSVSGIRTRGSRAIASLPPETVTNGPPSKGAELLKATSGISLALPA